MSVGGLRLKGDPVFSLLGIFQGMVPGLHAGREEVELGGRK